MMRRAAVALALTLPIGSCCFGKQATFSTAAGGKQVFAHYMLCFAAFGEKGNSSNATAGYQREMAVAQAAGLDGFAIEYLGRDAYYLPSAIGMFAACEAYNTALPAGAKRFRLFPIINFCCGQ